MERQSSPILAIRLCPQMPHAQRNVLLGFLASFPLALLLARFGGDSPVQYNTNCDLLQRTPLELPEPNHANHYPEAERHWTSAHLGQAAGTTWVWCCTRCTFWVSLSACTYSTSAAVWVPPHHVSRSAQIVKKPPARPVPRGGQPCAHPRSNISSMQQQYSRGPGCGNAANKAPPPLSVLFLCLLVVIGASFLCPGRGRTRVKTCIHPP